MHKMKREKEEWRRINTDMIKKQLTEERPTYSRTQLNQKSNHESQQLHKKYQILVKSIDAKKE